MPVRIHMLSNQSAFAAPRGSLLVTLVLGLLVLLVLALVLLPVALVIGGLGLIAFGGFKLNRWIRSLGQPRAAAPVSSSGDFDALRARLEQRSTTVPTDSFPSDHVADHPDDQGRRNVRVINADP